MLKTNKPNKTNVGADAPVCPHAITLVALIITVIILIILAGVTLNLALGQNGIFVKSKQAVDKYKDESQKEQNTLENIYQDMQAETGGGDDGVDYSQLNIGDYVNNYPVEYDNVGTGVRLAIGDYKYEYKKMDEIVPGEEYKGWRILSVDKVNKTVKLISTGIPLNYYHPYEEGNVPKSIENLTTNFFNTEITFGKEGIEEPLEYKFYQSGFKSRNESGDINLNTISEVEELFNNIYTAKINGKPNVRSMIKDDVEGVYGSEPEYNYPIDDDKNLLLIPCRKNDETVFAETWLASGNGNDYLRLIISDGCYYDNDNGGVVAGVRPVVTLETNVKFTKVNSDTNGTTTWNITAPKNP